jgi:hypothetical protein
MDTIFEALKQTPLVALCVILVYILKVVYKDWKAERKYRDEQELKNMETLTRVLEVVKENSLEKRALSDKVTVFVATLDRLERKADEK